MGISIRDWNFVHCKGVCPLLGVSALRRSYYCAFRYCCAVYMGIAVYMWVYGVKRAKPAHSLVVIMATSFYLCEFYKLCRNFLG